MKLLIKRDRNMLLGTQGKAELDSDVPAVLSTPHFVAPDYTNNVDRRYPGDDLLIMNPVDAIDMTRHLTSGIYSVNIFGPQKPTTNVKVLPAIWSGYRSVLVKNPADGSLYRIKGCALNPEKPEIKEFEDKTWEVYGGQPTYSAEFEKQMSDKFNKILANEGISPVMSCKGYWHYPVKAKRKSLSASIVQVEGDTRLDELMAVMENYFYFRLERQSNLNYRGSRLYEQIKQLYSDIGDIVGQIKSLMDRNNQTWSSDCERTNAHVGNIVVYHDMNQVKIGFVDFDSSCDANDFSKSKIKEIHCIEHASIVNSVMRPPISMRQINAEFMANKMVTFTDLKKSFAQGFIRGYARMNSINPINNAIDFSRFVEIFGVLRSREILRAIKQQVSFSGSLNEEGGLEKLINSKTKYSQGKCGNQLINQYNNNPYLSILDTNNLYQKSLLEDYIKQK